MIQPKLPDCVMLRRPARGWRIYADEGRFASCRNSGTPAREHVNDMTSRLRAVGAAALEVTIVAALMLWDAVGSDSSV